MVSDQFWCYKLGQDFHLFCVPPLDLTCLEWYELVFIMTTVTDAYALDDLQMVACDKNEHLKTAILMLASAHDQHSDIMDFLYRLNPNIDFNRLPLTPKEFIWLPPIVQYLTETLTNLFASEC